MSQFKEAIQACQVVLNLCSRTGFKLYEPYAEIILARAYLAQKDTDQAKSYANSAYDKATSMHYHLPKAEAKQLILDVQVFYSMSPCMRITTLV